MASLVSGGYASHDNVRQARQRGVKRAVFNKPSGLGLHETARTTASLFGSQIR